MNQVPRKYACDGHVETIDPERLIVGCVLRMPYSDGGSPTFGDSVVTGICTKSWRDSTKHPTFHDNLLSALQAATKEEVVLVKLSRPYLFSNNIGGGMPNWLVGVETYDAIGHTLTDTHKVVVMSTGEYANYKI
jgi:hypothetical protein